MKTIFVPENVVNKSWQMNQHKVPIVFHISICIISVFTLRFILHEITIMPKIDKHLLSKRLETNTGKRDIAYFGQLRHSMRRRQGIVSSFMCARLLATQIVKLQIWAIILVSFIKVF